ncbi:uncharacterized protein LOC130909550 [Corythoichthys intestinalis]|uniref:uncharacterized protein LOC130909550 n=1 Tax=Corythoichthys intestinalis TaxID=161448 RepID=UPI0025A541D3|nr:uncharacterized protein LOC130909550 [Corythoichthys intestinalis]
MDEVHFISSSFKTARLANMKWQVCFALILSLVCSAAREQLYFTEGQSLILRPEITGHVESLEWKRNHSLLVEWDGSSLLFSSKDVKNRTTLDVTNGTLEISDAVASDAGRYTLSLNNVELEQVFEAILVLRLDMPEVHVWPLKCTCRSDNCTLHCGKHHIDVGPVNYSWRTQPGGETQIGERDKLIDRTTSTIANFSCVVTNPVDRKVSDPIDNPFYQCDNRSTDNVVVLHVYFTAGQSLTLRPKITGQVESLEWKRNHTLLVEWDRGKLLFSSNDVKTRTTLDNKTGALQISATVATDAGLYTLLVNNMELDQVFEATFIRCLDTPQVYVSPLACTSRSDSCTLHCGKRLTDVGPVDYFWRALPGGEMQKGGWDRRIDRMNSTVAKFSCVAVNAVDRKESDPIDNPFYRWHSLSADSIMGMVVILVILVILTRRQVSEDESEGEAMNRLPNCPEDATEM